MIPLIILDDSTPNYLINRKNFVNIRLHQEYKKTSHATLIANSIFHPELGVKNDFITYWIQVYNYNKLDLLSLYESLDLINSTINTGVIGMPLGYTVENLNKEDFKIHLKIDKLLNKLADRFIIVSPYIKEKNLYPTNKNYVIKICDNKSKCNVKGTVWKTEIKNCIAFYDEDNYIIDIGESYYTVYLSWWITNYLNNNDYINNIFSDIQINKPKDELPKCFY